MIGKFLIRFLAVILIVGAAGTAAYALFQSSDKADQNLVYADRTLLNGLWDSYKETYWEESTGRTLDKQQNDITTSEGQSYTMLRAVWESDKTTFDKSWAWTQEQLQREDNLFSWRWGKQDDGSYGLFTNMGGQNTASDADSDLALALLMAGNRWQQQSYIDDANKIIKSMWEQEVVTVDGVPYLASNNQEKNSSQPIIMNPSYLAPYAFKEFAKVDKEHDWNAVADSSYVLINKSMDANLDKGSSAKLVPNWVAMDRTTGELSAPTSGGNLDTNYGYDAMRTPWRLGMDYEWNKDPRAKETLEKMSYLGEKWKNDSKIQSIYSHDGQVVTGDEVVESYGTSLSYFSLTDPGAAEDIYNQKIKVLYDQNTNGWSTDLTYYADNWVWFGIALYNHQLPNLVTETTE